MATALWRAWSAIQGSSPAGMVTVEQCSQKLTIMVNASD
jgi:hypothetical protein